MVKIDREQHMIRTAIIALLVALVFVYLLVYSIYYQPSVDRPATQSTTMTGIVRSVQDTLKVIPLITSSNEEVSETVVISKDKDNTTDNTSSSASTTRAPATVVSPGRGAYNPSQDIVTNGSSTTDTKDVIILPGTSLYTDSLVIADEVGIEYRYALRDEKGIYYLRLGPRTQNFEALLQAQGGNTYSLDTEAKIASNQLFGDRITFLNLPQYLNQKVFIVVEIGDDQRLVQIDYDLYHSSKAYLA
jgi:hypothetical protein